VLEPWSNAQTGGQINKLKTLKRAMYDRAGVDLLRARIDSSLFNKGFDDRGSNLESRTQARRAAIILICAMGARVLASVASSSPHFGVRPISFIVALMGALAVSRLHDMARRPLSLRRARPGGL
jgi:hypothetical protein